MNSSQAWLCSSQAMHWNRRFLDQIVVCYRIDQVGEYMKMIPSSLYVFSTR